jgi:limonene-1,2-epoxide hydrolase
MLVGSASASDKSTCPAKWNKYECEAVAVVNAWDAAWPSQDPQKIGALMAEDVYYSDNEKGPLKKGREQFEAQYAGWSKMIRYYDIKETYAAGDVGGAVVLQKRIDHTNRGGLPYTGVFKVKDGKITFWVDLPIAKMPPIPPDAAPPGGAGAPPPAGASPPAGPTP